MLPSPESDGQDECVDELRRSLGQQVREWRLRIDKLTVSELGTARRRAKGRLTQADLAWLTGVTEGWYRALENGCQRPFSDAFLFSVARALRLSRDETMALFVGAVGRPSPGAGPSASPDPARDVETAVNLCSPNPAYVLDHAANIVAVNSAMAEWFPWCKQPRANLLRWVLTSPEAREQFPNWHEGIARKYLGMLRYALALHSKDLQVRRLQRDVLSDDDCRRLWSSTFDVNEYCECHRFQIRLPVHYGAVMDVSTFVMQLTQRSNCWLAVILPNGAPSPRAPIGAEMVLMH
jgi:hypothetical protein